MLTKILQHLSTERASLDIYHIQNFVKKLQYEFHTLINVSSLRSRVHCEKLDDEGTLSKSNPPPTESDYQSERARASLVRGKIRPFRIAESPTNALASVPLTIQCRVRELSAKSTQPHGPCMQSRTSVRDPIVPARSTSTGSTGCHSCSIYT